MPHRENHRGRRQKEGLPLRVAVQSRPGGAMQQPHVAPGQGRCQAPPRRVVETQFHQLKGLGVWVERGQGSADPWALFQKSASLL